jgi:hypothetical protein
VFLSLRKCSLLCFLVLPLFSTNKIYLHEKLIQLKYFEKWFYKKEKSSYEMKAIIRFILCFWQLVYLVFFYQLVHFSHEQKKNDWWRMSCTFFSFFSQQYYCTSQSRMSRKLRSSVQTNVRNCLFVHFGHWLSPKIVH